MSLRYPSARAQEDHLLAADIEKPTTASEKSPTPRARGTRRGTRGSVAKPLRSIAIFGAVGALVAAVALPAYAASSPVADSTTLQQLAAADAQSLVVASEATAAPMDRGTYAATTPEEIAQKKAEEAAKARAAAAAASAASAAASSGATFDTSKYALVSPGSGAVRYPVPQGSYYVSRTLSSSHNGADMVAPAGTPIYAAAAGVVRISSESYYGYGVGIVIDSVVGGQRVSTLYGHMTYGSRVVSAGQTVQAGQLIGLVGNTGRSYGAHLHFEVRISDSLVEPIAWLKANAG